MKERKTSVTIYAKGQERLKSSRKRVVERAVGSSILIHFFIHSSARLGGERRIEGTGLELGDWG